MARNILEATDHLGWTAARQLHVGGGSMGGMIAQELCLLAAARIASLTLWSTAAQFQNTGSTAEHVGRVAGMLMPKTLERDIQDTARRNFPLAWLAGPDVAGVPDGSTPKCRVPEGGYGRFSSNYARWAAQETVKRETGRFTGWGFWMQGLAAGMHVKSLEQLRELARRVGAERIMVLHGAEDRGIFVELGERLIEALQPAQSLVVEGMGHQPFQERPAWFNGVLEEQFKRGERLSRSG